VKAEITLEGAVHHYKILNGGALLKMFMQLKALARGSGEVCIFSRVSVVYKYTSGTVSRDFRPDLIPNYYCILAGFL
jgi:hypothetical protein